MKSYTFDQLDERGQANAIFNHAGEYANNIPEFDDNDDHAVTMFSIGFMMGAGIRFTEHGERVA